MEFISIFGLFNLVKTGISILIVIQSAIAVKGVIALTKWNSFESNSGLMLFLVMNAFSSGLLYNGAVFLLAPFLGNRVGPYLD